MTSIRLPLIRLAASLYDAMIAMALLIFATFALMPFTKGHPIQPGNPLYQLYLSGILFVYWGGFWYFRGQTPGMLPWKIKIVNTHGNSISLTQSIIRFFTGFLFSFLGILFCFFSPNKISLNDYCSNTRVIYHE